MADRLDARLSAALARLREDGLGRALPSLTRRGAVTYDLGGRPVVGFCSNDYLGLATDPRIAGAHAATGAGASRLISGDWPEVRAAEHALAKLAGTTDAVLFPSGYQANVAALSALVRRDEHVFSDRLAHASLIDGLRLARANVTIVQHGERPPVAPERWWITESVFSMDGDRASMGDAATFLTDGGFVYLDEAHAFGLFPGGTGLAQHCNLKPTVVVGTLGKALGCAGAFVAGSAPLCDWLRTRSRGFVFSTGVSPMLAAAVTRAVALVRGEDGEVLRERLWANADHLARALGSTEPAPSPIFPLVLGDNADALGAASDLLDRGFHVQPIRPPTVPEGTARLRLTVSAAHEPAQIDALVHAIAEVSQLRGVEPSLVRGRTGIHAEANQPIRTGTAS